MKKQESKKGTVKQINPAVESTPETRSKKRTDKIKDAIFEAINTTAKKDVEKDGEVTINEVINVLTEMSYSYNKRNMTAQFEMDRIDSQKPQKK